MTNSSQGKICIRCGASKGDGGCNVWGKSWARHRYDIEMTNPDSPFKQSKPVEGKDFEYMSKKDLQDLIPPQEKKSSRPKRKCKYCDSEVLIVMNFNKREARLYANHLKHKYD